MINILLLSCTVRRPYAPQQPEKQSSFNADSPSLSYTKGAI